jgi:hypothetical protein
MIICHIILLSEKLSELELTFTHLIYNKKKLATWSLNHFIILTYQRFIAIGHEKAVRICTYKA